MIRTIDSIARISFIRFIDKFTHDASIEWGNHWVVLPDYEQFKSQYVFQKWMEMVRNN